MIKNHWKSDRAELFGDNKTAKGKPTAKFL